MFKQTPEKELLEKYVKAVQGVGLRSEEKKIIRNRLMENLKDPITVTVSNESIFKKETGKFFTRFRRVLQEFAFQKTQF